MITLVDYDVGPDATDRTARATDPGEAGALAALESFYYALNHADLDVLAAVWSQHELAQLNNPVGGIRRSGAAVTDLYRRIFAGRLGVRVTFTDAATYTWPGTTVFAGREIGDYIGPSGARVPLRIRTPGCSATLPRPAAGCRCTTTAASTTPTSCALTRSRPPPASRRACCWPVAAVVTRAAGH